VSVTTAFLLSELRHFAQETMIRLAFLRTLETLSDRTA